MDTPLRGRCGCGTVRFEVVRPFVSAAKVTATVLENGRGPKLVVGKFKRRKAYRRVKGHRQDYTRIRIDSVTA